jgi:protein-tyrosine phosphatase
VLFHCMGGRDRTGMIAMLLLAAADTEPDDIVDDYLETVRLGNMRAVAGNRTIDEPAIEAYCQARGTSTEGAFRTALAGLDLTGVLTAAKVSRRDRLALGTWRGALPQGAPARQAEPSRPGAWLGLARHPAEFVHFGRLARRRGEVRPPA